MSSSGRARRLGVAVVMGATALVATACDLGTINLPVGKSQVVIHGVLSPSASAQTVLIERTLTGEFPTTKICTVCGDPYAVNPSQPVISDGGIPERGASIELTTPTGQVIVGRELTPPPTVGGGLYQIALAGSALVPGGRYQLRIVTTRQEVVTAETVVPDATPVAVAPTVDFNRVIDTLALAWPTVASAYQVRVESPYGAWSSFTENTRVALTGSLRSINSNLTRVFIPGFTQMLTVSAVDANLYDYYRTSNNSFTGSGIVSRVNGALGVFGSMVTVSRRAVRVTAPAVQPIEGTFDLAPGNLGYTYGGEADAMSLTIYIESPSARHDQPDAITASNTYSVGGNRGAAVGTFSASKLRLAFLRNQALTDTMDVLTAELRGDTLVGTFQKGAPAKYVRRP